MSCQQDALYAAQQAVTRGRAFLTEEEMQSYVDELREHPWWESNFPGVLRIEAYFRPKGSGSIGGWYPSSSAGKIEILPVHRNELIVLHEVSHVLASARYGSGGTHDPWFARIYLEAVFVYMGTTAYSQLYAGFTQQGVDHDVDSSYQMGRVV